MKLEPKKLNMNCKMLVPYEIYNQLHTSLNFSLVSIKGIKQQQTFSTAFWSISALLIHKCAYQNQNLDYFINIHKNKFIDITTANTSTIKHIKQILIQGGFIDCNFNHCDKGPNHYSYGYRIHPLIKHIFSSKYKANNKQTLIEYKVNYKYLINEYKFNNSTINKLINDKLKTTDILYIKRDKIHSNQLENQIVTHFAIYNDRNEMNEYEKKLSQRMKRISVDITKLNQCVGNDLKKLYWISRIIHYKGDDEVKFSHGRLYRNPYWHCFPKEYRHCCIYDKKDDIVEGFDVKNCFATLLLKVIEGKISNQEYEKYKRIVRTGIYEDIAEMTLEYDRNDMKQPFCHWLFANNTTKKLALNDRFTIIRNYFKNEFPQIYNLVTNYPEIDVEENGKIIKKSKLSVDCQWIENELVLNTLCKWTEEKFNVECWTLHDAICCKSKDYIKINWPEVKGYWCTIMNLL